LDSFSQNGHDHIRRLWDQFEFPGYYFGNVSGFMSAEPGFTVAVGYSADFDEFSGDVFAKTIDGYFDGFAIDSTLAYYRIQFLEGDIWFALRCGEFESEIARQYFIEVKRASERMVSVETSVKFLNDGGRKFMKEDTLNVLKQNHEELVNRYPFRPEPGKLYPFAFLRYLRERSNVVSKIVHLSVNKNVVDLAFGDNLSISHLKKIVDQTPQHEIRGYGISSMAVAYRVERIKLLDLYFIEVGPVEMPLCKDFMLQAYEETYKRRRKNGTPELNLIEIPKIRRVIDNL